MATAAKAKPKAALKTNPGRKATAKPPAKAKAPKAAKPAKPAKPTVLLEPGTFVKFNGYANEVPADEAVFAKDDILYITGVDESDEGVLYDAVPAAQVGIYESEGEDSENLEGGQVGASEVTELKGGQLDKAREAYMPIRMVGRLSELMEAHEGNAIEVAVELSQDIQENYFYLGGALAQVLQDGSYLKANGGEYEGEDAFNDFCQNEFGFKASKGRQLARIYSTLSSIPDFDAVKLRGIGWSLVSKAERYITAENVDEVLDTVSETTQRTADAVLREKFVTASGATPSGREASRGAPKALMTTMNFRLTEDGAETVKLVLQQCMKQTGIENEALALERIVTEWAGEHVEAETVKKRIVSKAAKAAKAREAAAAPKPKAKAA